MVDAFVGEIRLFGGDYAPEGWAMCNGQILLIREAEVLFSIIGAAFGGDGETNFGLPDLRGRVPIGYSDQAPNSTNRPFASTGGSNQVALKQDEIPAHTHAMLVSGEQATTPKPSAAVTFGAVADNALFYVDVSKGASTGIVSFAAEAVSVQGGGLPHPNIMPSMGMTYIICLSGEYPPFS